MGMSGNGRLVYAHPESNSPVVVTEAGGVQTFEALMRASGLDPDTINFERILDVSDDGRAFLVEELRELGSGRLISLGVLVVIPEPGTGLLLGLGLAALAASGRTRNPDGC